MKDEGMATPSGNNKPMSWKSKATKQPETKLQTALEYLMTYSWALLIVAVIFVVLWQYGIFDPYFFTTKAFPGTCSVVRPGGSGSTAQISLAGECTDLIPEYTMQNRGPGDFVAIPNSEIPSSPLNITNSITIAAWVEVLGSPYHDVVDKEDQYGMKLDYNNNPQTCEPGGQPGWCLEWDTSPLATGWIGEGYEIPGAAYGKWMFLAVAEQINPGGATSTKYWYANGQLLGTESVTGALSYQDSNMMIGAETPGYSGYGIAEWFNGSIADVQIYNASLSTADIEALYLEGIGGLPIDLQNLIAWYPLNENTNDYSGNSGLDGNQANVFYTNTWYYGYTPP